MTDVFEMIERARQDGAASLDLRSFSVLGRGDER